MQREVRRPSRLAFASGTRLMSVHEDDNRADARVSTFVRTFLPRRRFRGTRHYHAFDVLVTGGNPLLASLLVARAASAGLDVGVTLPGPDDGWPYDLASSARASGMVSSAIGRPAEGAVSALLRASATATVLPFETFAASGKHPAGEFGIYPDPARSPCAEGTCFSRFRDEFVSAARFLRKAAVNPADRTTVVFARRLVVTSLAGGFGVSEVSRGTYGNDIRWSHPSVRATGTAAARAASGRDAAEAMIDDLIRCSRGEPVNDVPDDR